MQSETIIGPRTISELLVANSVKINNEDIEDNAVLADSLHLLHCSIQQAALGISSKIEELGSKIDTLNKLLARQQS